MKLLRNPMTSFLIASVLAVCAISTQVHSAPPQQSFPYSLMAPGGGGAQFTVTSGCATVSAIKGGSTGGQFSTTATTCTPVIAFGLTAPTGWICFAQDVTHNVVFTQTASSTTGCTVTGTTTSGDVVQIIGFWY